MTFDDVKTGLADALAAVTNVVANTPAEDWHRAQGEKWTLAQETDHLLKATQNTAMLFSAAGRGLWRPNERPSLPYDDVVAAYKAALAGRVSTFNPATSVADGSQPAGRAEQFRQAAALMKASLDALPEADLDDYTVWKHPLIGPVTGREMLYFTLYHTEHHRQSMLRKQAALV